MTVQAANPPFNEYTAAAGATVFAYQFKVIRPGDMSVMVNGVAKVVDTDYTLTGVGSNDGGNITFLAPMVGGENVLARIDMPFDRQTDYQQNGDFLSPTVNNDFDRVWIAIQQVGQSIMSAIKLPFTTTSEQTIPQSAAERANTVLAFDASGNITISTTDAANVAAAQAAAAAAQAAAASIDPTNLVHRTGNETIAGTKTFSTPPVVGTATAGTADTTAASTGFASTAVAASAAVPRFPKVGATAVAASNAITITIPAGEYYFRHPTLNNGLATPVVLLAPKTLTIPTGATMGTTSAIESTIGYGLAYNGGNPVVFATNASGGNQLDGENLISPTVISASATSAFTIYSASAVSANSPYLIVGYLRSTQATAGTWATAPTVVQPGPVDATFNRGIAKAKVAFTGSSGTIVGNSFFNIASVSRTATGKWTVVYARPIRNWTFSLSYVGDGSTGQTCGVISSSDSGVNVFGATNGVGPADLNTVFVTVFGDY